jgi:hypothetical protein
MNERTLHDADDNNFSTRTKPIRAYKRRRSQQPPTPTPMPTPTKRQRPRAMVEASTASTGDDLDDEEIDDESLLNKTPIRNRERRRALLSPQAPSHLRLPPPVSSAASRPASSAPLLAPRRLLLPRYRARGNITVAALSNHPAFFGRTDRIVDGSAACARMDEFLKGGSARRALADRCDLGNLGETNISEMRRLLKERYATPENDQRFDGALNTLRLIDFVLLPELAIVLVMHACGDKITEEQAVELLEQPIVSEAERMRLVAEARGASRLQRALER